MALNCPDEEAGVDMVAPVTPTTTIVDAPADARAWSRAQRRSGRTVALVPTMGALHAGHRALIERARTLADAVAVSIFVNPLQFGEIADLESYPTPIDDDLEACRVALVDLVYAPTAATMYPPRFQTRVHTGSLADGMEGHSRPGHFDGVATVVTKLFGALEPDVAVFGEKDFQQLAIVRQMVTDLDLGVTVIGAPTVREADGLALSSRNRRLDPAQRAAAAVMPRALEAARIAAAAPGPTPRAVRAAALAVLAAETLASVDYVTVFDAETLQPVEHFGDDRSAGRVRIAIAARVGDVRLIDNADVFGP